MQITFENVTQNPYYYLSNVLTGTENLIVASENGNLLITREEDWNQLNETIRLLTDKKSLQSLLEGIKARQTNTPINSYSIEDVFSGI